MEVLAIKEKKLAELNDEFAKGISDSQTIEELRTKVRKGLEAERDQRQTAAVRDALLAKLTAAHNFPVPEAMVEQQMDTRLERAVRTLAAQGVDPRAVNVDWVAMRQRQRERAGRTSRPNCCSTASRRRKISNPRRRKWRRRSHASANAVANPPKPSAPA